MEELDAERNSKGMGVVTGRDLEIVRWLARVRYATAGQVAQRFQLSERVAYRRLRACVQHGLVWHQRHLMGPGVYGATDGGAAAAEAGLSGSRWNLRDYVHTVAVVDLVTELEGAYPGRVLTERELLAAHYEDTRSKLRPSHLPDAVLQLARPVAVEVELNAKSTDRLRHILDGYLRSDRFEEVWYYAPPAVASRIEELAVARYSFVRIHRWTPRTSAMGRSASIPPDGLPLPEH